MSVSDRLLSDHIRTISKTTQEALTNCKVDTLLIYSGKTDYYFADDHAITFQPTPEFVRWCPVASPGHLIVVRRGERPRLLMHITKSFWHEHHGLQGEPWEKEFDIEVYDNDDLLWKSIREQGVVAAIGPQVERFENLCAAINPPRLTAHLDWHRSYKTPYEIWCMEEANRIAAPAHLAARSAFLEGASEIEIHQSYMAALGCMDKDLPYPSIVALDAKGGYLHYEGKRHQRNGKVLLIDSGARFRGYCSDITRTYLSRDADPLFKDICLAVEELQKSMCKRMQPGTTMGQLQLTTHEMIADIAIKFRLLRDTTPSEAVEKGLTKTFFPHGLGHMLGIQVHDVGGKQLDPDGTLPPAVNDGSPYLRNRRPLEPGHVITCEPGFYFIPVLMQEARAGDYRDRYDWQLMDRLAPFGGVRIEDDILVTESGHHNLTRPYTNLSIVP